MSPTLVVQLIQALGLSTSAGLNAWVTLFIVSVASHFHIITLSEPFQVMGDIRVVIVLGILVIIEGLADKIPGFDHASHVVHMIIQPAAGALLFASQAGIVTQSAPWFAVLVGALVAGTVHTTRAVARVPVTATTAGMGNWVVSLTEDVMAVGITLTALLAPWISAILLLIMAVLIFRLVRWSRHKIGSKTRNSASGRSSSGVNV